VFEPAQTQDDAQVVVDRFELGPNEIREGYQTPSPYTSYRYSDESLETLQERDEARGQPAPAVKMLPHAQAEQEAGQARLGELGPAIEAVDQHTRDQGIELPAERAQRWQDDVEAVKGGGMTIEESSRKVLEGRVNRTQDDMVPTGDDDYEASEGSGAGKTGRKTGKAATRSPARAEGNQQAAEQAKAEEARRKAQERRANQER
jgi:hypothetical protein